MPVLLADDQVNAAVSVPVGRDGHDHLHVHAEDLPVAAELNALGKLRVGRRADVFVEGQRIEEFAADHVVQPVAVKVGEARCGVAVGRQFFAAGLNLGCVSIFGVVVGAVVFHPPHLPGDRAVGPLARGVVVIVPAVVAPVAEADRQVIYAVVVEVVEPPEVGSADIKRRIEVDGGPVRQPAGLKLVVAFTGRGHDPLAVAGARDLKVARRAADRLSLVEFVGLAAAFAGKMIDGVFVFGRARHQQVELAVVVVIHRQGVAPQTDAELDHQSGVVVAHALQAVAGRYGQGFGHRFVGAVDQAGVVESERGKDDVPGPLGAVEVRRASGHFEPGVALKPHHGQARRRLPLAERGGVALAGGMIPLTRKILPPLNLTVCIGQAVGVKMQHQPLVHRQVPVAVGQMPLPQVSLHLTLLVFRKQPIKHQNFRYVPLKITVGLGRTGPCAAAQGREQVPPRHAVGPRGLGDDRLAVRIEQHRGHRRGVAVPAPAGDDHRVFGQRAVVGVGRHKFAFRRSALGTQPAAGFVLVRHRTPDRIIRLAAVLCPTG